LIGPRRAAIKVGGVGLDSQTLAALGAACVDHGAATTGLHAHEKAMRTRAADLGRLIGTFHDGKSL
jgi:hypothetical protein